MGTIDKDIQNVSKYAKKYLQNLKLNYNKNKLIFIEVYTYRGKGTYYYKYYGMVEQYGIFQYLLPMV